ncbi:unnamed protein product [Rotaria socialis]|uniref:Uncharacterized protein n=1 Tax=Rotaria socialis TaxID=392032 RepID=A0A818RHN1_9BILA|nr:unnamed protein product [Rotaria socialis]
MCIVVSCDYFTDVFAGFAVFATIGYLSTELKESVSKYADASGPGLAFITYPEAIAHMPATLGLGSQFALTDVPITSILELFPRFKFQRELAVIITGVVLFLISLPFTCPVRIEVVLNFISEYRRFNRFMNDVKMMLGKRAAEYYLFLTWCILSPIIMLVITFSNLWTSKQMSNGAGAGYEAYVDPGWSTVIGW